MNIVHLSTFDAGVGAAIAARRLHDGLLRLGENSRMFVLDRRGDDPAVLGFTPPRDPLSRLRRGWLKRRIRGELAAYAGRRPVYARYFSDDRSEHGVHVVRQIPPADLYNLHWVARLVDYRAFFGPLSLRAPLVWRLADMNPFTGGCHYDFGCGRFAAGCGACPQLGSADRDDLSAQIWRRKAAALSSVPAERLHVVALNRWMAGEVTRSPLLGRFPLSIIPNGLDVALFAPAPRAEARAVLGVSCEARVLLFVADDIGSPFKGFAVLAEAVARIARDEPVELLVVGRGEFVPMPPVPVRRLGYVGDDRRRALAYSAADLFVCASTQDNFPSTVLESLACGTPVVGFAAGGVPDMLTADTGVLVSPGDSAALGAAIIELLRNPERRVLMAGACRRRAVAEYALEVQAVRYQQLYRQILGGMQTRPAALTDVQLR